MKKTEYPVPDPKNHDLTHIITGSEEAILALQTLLNERRREGRSIGRAEADERIKSLELFLRLVKTSLEDGTASRDTVWFGPSTTLLEAIEGMLETHEGQPRLPLELAG